MKKKAIPGDAREADHRSDRAGWLRAAVLGLDDAVVSTASLSSQRDAERADVELEKKELAEQPQAELKELAESSSSPRAAS